MIFIIELIFVFVLGGFQSKVRYWMGGCKVSMVTELLVWRLFDRNYQYLP